MIKIIKLVVFLFSIFFVNTVYANNQCGWEGTITLIDQFQADYVSKTDQAVYHVNINGSAEYDYTHNMRSGDSKCAILEYAKGHGKTNTAVKFDLAAGNYRIEIISAQIRGTGSICGVKYYDTFNTITRASWGTNGPDGFPETDGVTFGHPWGKLGPDKSEIKGSYNGKISGDMGTGTSTVTWDLKAVCTPELDVDKLSHAKNKSPGALIVLNSDNNNAPRKKITLKVPDPQKTFAAPIELHWTDDLALYRDSTLAASSIPQDHVANVFTSKQLPQDFYVEGKNTSEDMGRAEIWASLVGHQTHDEKVNFTVLWIDEPVLQTDGRIPDGNPILFKIQKNLSVNKSEQLGLGLYKDTPITVDGHQYKVQRMGWGLEFQAKVHPSNFNYPLKQPDLLYLDRDYANRDYWDMTLIDRNLDGKLKNKQTDYSEKIPPGQDPSPLPILVDGLYKGILYDIDAPGLSTDLEVLIDDGSGRNPTNSEVPENAIKRTRNNFREFATLTLDGQQVRCSPITEYHVLFSMRLIRSDKNNKNSPLKWVVIEPGESGSVIGDKDAGYGKMGLSWDLRELQTKK